MLCSRRSWTALSLAVLGAVAWVVLVRRAAGLNTAPAWAVAGLAAVSGVVWVRTQQTIFRIRRALGRAVVLFHLG